MSINLLPDSVWSRIAAGEVVERPSSAVKEMIENSLDAGARRIRVKLWDGGRVRIVVEDDGSGIAFDELPLALTRHATSKIGGIEDLDAIHTLGYRGEALASLVAVAKVEIRSRTADGDGGLIRAYEGHISSHVETNCAPGTRVQADELFVNLPARRKFLKSAAGELRRVASLLREYAICRPEVGFALEHDGRPIFSTDGGGDRRRAIEQLWGAEPEITTVEATVGHIELECWWQPRQGRNDVTSFVNGRSVNDPLIKGAVGAAARELVGGWALFFSVDPSLIDVNIHPAKTEIRFRHPGEVFDVMKEAAARLGGCAPVYIRDGRTFSTNSTNSTPSPNPMAPVREHRGEPETKKTQSRDFRDTPRTSAPLQTSRTGPLFRPMEIPDFAREAPEFVPPFVQGEGEADRTEFSSIELSSIEISSIELSSGEPDVTYLGQLGSGYLVFDTPDGAALVDPHAAHERVAFEHIRAAAKEGQREQSLLTPIPLPPTLQLEAEEREDLLKSVGFALDRIDGGLRLTAIPSIMNVDMPPEALLRGSLAALRDGGDADPIELLWRSWATMACKEAVKATTKLAPAEA
ncbi:MAG: DNA mismatch repair endonuclease MutL, partial [Synergistaceae bacterium]|nr:DNA mismatch repair endonuclease MutL [Synergistaceae bacterium]